MSRIAIIYFSGTGNTWYIARQYERALIQLEQQVDLLPLERVLRAEDQEALAGYDLLGLGYPIHAWNAPRLMANFMRRLPRSAGQRLFLFVTTDLPVAGAFDWARDLLARRGYALVHEAHYYVANNFLFAQPPKQDETTFARRLAWLDADVQEAAAEILAGHERHTYASRAERWLLSNLVWQFYRFGCRHIYRFFHVREACNQCGLCVRLCPARNIRLVEGRLRFGAECTFCLRCMNLCPQQAIEVRLLNLRLARYVLPTYRPTAAPEDDAHV